jgi:hypothetical protein
VFITELEEE